MRVGKRKEEAKPVLVRDLLVGTVFIDPVDDSYFMRIDFDKTGHYGVNILTGRMDIDNGAYEVIPLPNAIFLPNGEEP